MTAMNREPLVEMRAFERVGDSLGNMVPAGETFLATPRRAMVVIAGGWGELVSDDQDTWTAVLAYLDDHNVVAGLKFRAEQVIGEALVEGLRPEVWDG